MKIRNLQKAVRDYKEANIGGKYDSIYGFLMLNRKTGELWTDWFCSTGHTSFISYADKSIVNLVSWAMEYERLRHNIGNFRVNTKTVKEWAEQACKDYSE